MGKRVVLQGARDFDGTGAGPRPTVDVRGKTVLPGFIDCHVHVTMSGVNQLTSLHAPFSYQFYAAERNLRDTLVTYLIDRPSLSRRTS